MIRDGHISLRNLATLLWFVMGSKIFLVVARIMVVKTNNSAWIAIFIGAMLALGVLYILYRLMDRFHDKSIIGVGESILGPWAGKVCALVIVLFFFTVTTLRLREFSETISAVILPRTPISVIMITYTVLMLYATQCGLEALSRGARLLLPFVVVPAIIITILAIPLIRPLRALPIIDAPISAIGSGGLYAVTLFSEVVVVGLLAPYLRKTKELLSGGIIGVTLSAILMAIMTMMTIMVFSVRNAYTLQFPTFQITSLISFSNFFERVESLYVFIWFFSAALTLSILFYGTCQSMAQTLGLKEYKPLVWPLSLIIYTLAFLPSNIVTAFNTDFMTLGTIIGAVVMVLPIGLFGLALIMKKGGQEE